MVRRLVPILILVFVIFYVATDPDGAAEVTRGIGEAIASFFRAVGRFLENIFSS